MTYVLALARGKQLSEHPNEEGAKLSALFYVKNKETIIWETDKDSPAQVALCHGLVRGKRRFVIHV
jgi:hypothetical protein